jgi:YHS domain-containing protein
MIRKLIFSGVAVAALSLYAGCNRGSPEPPSGAGPVSAPKPVMQAATEDHHDQPGAHGGQLISLGADNYHAEAVFEKGGKLRLFILGKDESRVQEVEQQTITAQVRLESDYEAEPDPILLQSEPLAGDSQGKTSQFVGILPGHLRGKKVVVTFVINIGGDRFRRSFASASLRHDDGMPEPLSEEEERSLYLTPGGKYTEADIAANGHMTASEKFKGLRSSHNARTTTGDRICPISETKANPKFTWIVGGKTYEFCCPPCVDEFVKLAKEQPEQIKEPEAYRKP